MANNQEATQEKQKRILARLYHDPTWAAESHLAMLAEIDDPLLAGARDTILKGPEAVTAVTDPVLFHIINDILIDHRPPAAALAGRKQMTGGELAAALMGDDAVLVLPFETAGTGDWPAAPARESVEAEPLGSVIAIKASAKQTTIKAGYRWRRTWETDRREYYFRARREVEKAHAELAYQSMHYHLFDDLPAVTRFINTRRMADKRADTSSHVYCHYPHITGDGEVHIIVSNYARGAAGDIPADRAAALALFHEWVNTPEDVSINRKSNGYGRQWQGMKGDGSIAYAMQKAAESGAIEDEQPQAAALQLLTEMLPNDLLKAIGRTQSQTEFTIDNADMPDFFRLLLDRVPDIKMRGGGNPLTAWRLCTQVWNTGEIDKKVCQTRVQKQTEEKVEELKETSEEELDAILGGAK